MLPGAFFEPPVPPAQRRAPHLARGQVGVHLAVAFGPPHVARGKSIGPVRDMPAAHHRATEKARQFAALNEIKTPGETHMVAELQSIARFYAQVRVKTASPDR